MSDTINIMKMNNSTKLKVLTRIDEICQKHDLLIIKNRYFLKLEEQPSFYVHKIGQRVYDYQEKSYPLTIFLNEEDDFIHRMNHAFGIDHSIAKEFYNLITNKPQYVIIEFFKFKELQFKEYSNKIRISKSQPYSFFYNGMKISKLGMENYNFDESPLPFLLDNLQDIKKSFHEFCFEKKIKEDALLEEFLTLIKYANYSSKHYDEYLYK